LQNKLFYLPIKSNNLMWETRDVESIDQDVLAYNFHSHYVTLISPRSQAASSERDRRRESGSLFCTAVCTCRYKTNSQVSSMR